MKKIRSVITAAFILTSLLSYAIFLSRCGKCAEYKMEVTYNNGDVDTSYVTGKSGTIVLSSGNLRMVGCDDVRPTTIMSSVRKFRILDNDKETDRK